MAARRLQPRIWNTDWLLLRGMRRVLADELAQCAGPGARLIDFGCGDMPYRSLVEAQGAHYLGADLPGGEADLVLESNGRIPAPDGAADIVLSVQVLEHIRDLDAYCAEIARVLKDDGRLILSTHGSWLYHPHPEDFRRWTRVGLRTDLEARGFEIEGIRAVVGPLATTTIVRLTGFAHVLKKAPVIGGALAAIISIVMNLRAQLEDRITPPAMRENDGCVYFVRARKRLA